MLPEVGSSSLMRVRMTVDLPDPVEPIRKTNSPRSTLKVAWSRPMSPEGYLSDTPRNSMTGREAAGEWPNGAERRWERWLDRALVLPEPVASVRRRKPDVC